MSIVFRKWGFYITLISRKRFKVKLLRFKRGGQLSAQYHNKRNELWLFLNGVDKGRWRVIPEQELHTYYAKRPTYVLEIQYGDKCEESDIVRL